jgi:hypothetical protein
MAHTYPEGWQCRQKMLPWWFQESRESKPLFPDLFRRVRELLVNDPDAINEGEYIKLWEEIRRVGVGLPPEDEQDALDKLTPTQAKVVRYLRARKGQQVSISDAMRAFKKSPASKVQRKSFLATVRRLNERLAKHYKHLVIDLDRIAKTITLLES